MEEIRVERVNGVTSVYLGENEILGDISFRVGWGKGIESRDCKFTGVEREKGRNGVGRFENTIFRYEYSGSEIRFIFRAYQEPQALYLGIENELGEKGFSHQTCELSIGRIPGFKRGFCCSNSWEGLKKFPTSLPEAKFFLGILAEHFPLAVRKPKTLAGYAFWHLVDKGARYAGWSYPKFLRVLEDIPDHTLFLSIEAERQLTFLPVSAWGQKSSLAWEEGHLKLKSWGFDSTKLYREIPGVVMAIGDPYSSTPIAFRILKEVTGKKILLGRDKEEAEVLGKLGWCSWNAFYRDFGGGDIVGAVKSMKEKRIPIRFVIIDDGWQRRRSRMLTSLYPKEGFDVEKVIDELKGLGVENVGLWHALQGYWMGIHPKSELAGLAFRGSDGRLIPMEKEFFDRWYRAMAGWGVDFVKVDNQFDLLPSFVNRIPIEEAASKILSNLHAATEGKLKTILNCMEVVPECYYNDRTPTYRCSADYSPRSKDGTKKHLISCAYNSFWISNMGIPDYDMFQTHDPNAIPHAIARAMSGGPIYLTDEPHKSDETIARMLCLDDGEVPRPDFPALVSPDSLFDDPYTTTKPLKLFTRIGEIGLVAAFNLNKDGKEEKAVIAPGDALMPEDEYAIYGVRGKEMVEGKAVARLDELGAEVFVISPIRNGFAPIGIGEIFIPPGGIRILRFNPFACEVKKSGTLVGYGGKGVKVKIDGRTVKPEVRDKCLRLGVGKGETITVG